MVELIKKEDGEIKKKNNFEQFYISLTGVGSFGSNWREIMSYFLIFEADVKWDIISFQLFLINPKNSCRENLQDTLFR